MTPPPGGRGGGLGPWPASAGPPTPRHQKHFPRVKNETYERGRKSEAEFRYTNYFWPLTHPPLSNGPPHLNTKALCQTPPRSALAFI